MDQVASSSASASATSPVLSVPLMEPSDANPIPDIIAAAAIPSVDLTNETDNQDISPPGKRVKKSTSIVWDYYTKYKVTVKDPNGNDEVQLWASCNKKGCTYKGRAESTRGTSVFKSHLRNKHSITVGQQILNLKKGEGDNSSASIETYRYDEAISLKKFYLAIIMHEYPFNIVEHEYFVDFIKSLHPSFPIRSRITVRKDILNMFVEEKKKLYEYFKTLQCRFSTTMDMWTSNQNKGYMCITVHWIDDNWCMQKRIIKFMHVEGHHSGKNLCLQFYDSIVDWNLDRKLLALTLDNAASNDKCVQGVVSKLNKISPLICDGIFFHVRCMNHILNLVAQDGLKTIAQAIANIRNTIAIVKNSTLQYEEFKKCASECDLDVTKGLSLDVPTRWNSTYLMLKNAIYYQDAFGRLFLRHRSKYMKYAPTSNNWAMATSISACLKPFFDATELFSGTKYPTANLFFRKFCQIKIAIAEWCESSDVVIKAMAHSMKIKFDKYWEKSNMALAVACFFDPRYKNNVIQYYALLIYSTTSMQEIDKCTKVVNQLFEAYISTSKKATYSASATNLQQMSSQLDDVDEEDDLDMFLHSISESNHGTKSELQVYLEQPLASRKDKDFDILLWWKLKQGEFPILSRLARDVLSIQVSTVASESAFSAGGRVVDPFRTRLDPEIVQALICTKDWTAASKGGNIASIISELDMESLERRFTSLVEMLEEQDNANDNDIEEDDMMEEM